MASWSSGDTFVCGIKGLGFKSLTSQIRLKCCQKLTPAVTFLQKELCCPGAMARIWAPSIHYMIRHNTASKDLIKYKPEIMKASDLVCGLVFSQMLEKNCFGVDHIIISSS